VDAARPAGRAERAGEGGAAIVELDARLERRERGGVGVALDLRDVTFSTP
jgi:hypothetical protein